MVTEAHHITVGGLTVEVVRKDIKNLHLRVYPPNGRIRVAAPLVVSDEAVRLAVIGKLGWIKRQQVKFEGQPRRSQREMVSGESHYFLGQCYRLRVLAYTGPPRIRCGGADFLDLFVRPETTAAQRQRVLEDWYREQLRGRIPALLEQWQPVLQGEGGGGQPNGGKVESGRGGTGSVQPDDQSRSLPVGEGAGDRLAHFKIDRGGGALEDSAVGVVADDGGQIPIRRHGFADRVIP